MVYKYRTCDQALKEITQIDKQIARYEISQRMIKPSLLYQDKIDTLTRERRTIITDFNVL